MSNSDMIKRNNKEIEQIKDKLINCMIESLIDIIELRKQNKELEE